MRRREFLAGAALLVSGLRPALAQQPPAKKRLAVATAAQKLDSMRDDPYSLIFIDELKRLGYVEGDNLIIDRYSAEGKSERYDAVAREVVATNPDVISTGGTPLTLRFKAATSTIPVVTLTGDPIRFGIVSSLSRPGGNITGVSADAGVGIWGKRLELLSQAVPNLKRVVFLSTQGGWNGPGGQAARSTAQSLGIALTSVIVNSPYAEAEYRHAFGTIQKDEIDGIMISDEFENAANRLLIAQLVQQMRIPGMFSLRHQSETGGLMSYSWVRGTSRPQSAGTPDRWPKYCAARIPRTCRIFRRRALNW
jgi:putative tryptophan/tyrosine transport system substrate-binding protein